MKKKLETLIQKIRIYSQDIGMEFGVEKCAKLIMRSGKRQWTEVIALPNQEKISTLEEKEYYKFWGILEEDTIKKAQMKEKIRKEYFRQTRKLLETKLCHRNLFKGIDTWMVFGLRYSGPFLKWTREELRQIDQWTRKMMTMHKALHLWNDIDKLYVSKNEGGRGLANIEENVDVLIRLEDYIKKSKERLITATRKGTDTIKINRSEDKEGDDNAQGLTPVKWYRQTICVKKWKRTRTRQHWR